MRKHEATSYLNTSSNQNASSCRSGRDHLLIVVHDEHGAHPAGPPRRISWDGYQQPDALVSTDLSSMGICDQRLHPERQSAW